MVGNTGPLRGVITPLVTPLHPDGTVDVESVRRLVRYQLSSGVDGVFPLGTSGEVSFLTASQRQQVITAVVEEVAGAVPVLAGIVESSASRAIEAGKAARDSGADYLVATGPYYGDIAESEVPGYFEQITEALDLPLLAYDIPVKTNRKLSVRTVLQLAEREIVVGLKDSSGDFWGFRTITTRLRSSNFALFTGSDPMVDTALLMGASGAVVGVANVAPHLFLGIRDAAARGDWNEARELQERVARLAAIQGFGISHGTGGDASFTGALKEALVQLGVIDFATMAAGGAYPQALRGSIREVLHAEGILDVKAANA